MPPPLTRKATLHKIFMLDEKGAYRGVVPLDEMCLVEYEDFLAALPEKGLADGESIFLTEWKATAIYGEKVGIIAISKGSLGSEEIQWARAALVAAESILLGKVALPLGDTEGDTEDEDALESVARDLESRERQLRQREEAFKIMEQSTRSAVEEYRQEMEAQIADLKGQLDAARVGNVRDLGVLAAERDRLRRELEAHASAPKASPWRDPEHEEAQEKLAEDRKAMQKKALEFLEREETLRDRETKVEEEGRKLLETREEIDQKFAEIEAAKSAAPPFDQEAAKREIDQRVMILQQKAFDLMAREELLKKRAGEIQALLNSTP